MTTATEQLSPLEKQVLRKLLEGQSKKLQLLQQQAELARIKTRDSTGVGFFAELSVPAELAIPELRKRFVLTGVSATIPGLAHGAGFALFIEEGRLMMLEGFSYDEPWPSKIEDFVLEFDQEAPRDLTALL
jgi:hypothetical protein